MKFAEHNLEHDSQYIIKVGDQHMCATYIGAFSEPWNAPALPYVTVEPNPRRFWFSTGPNRSDDVCVTSEEIVIEAALVKGRDLLT